MHLLLCVCDLIMLKNYGLSDWLVDFCPLFLSRLWGTVSGNLMLGNAGCYTKAWKTFSLAPSLRVRIHYTLRHCKTGSTFHFPFFLFCLIAFLPAFPALNRKNFGTSLLPSEGPVNHSPLDSMITGKPQFTLKNTAPFPIQCVLFFVPESVGWGGFKKPPP